MNTEYICNCCKKSFKSQRSINCHISKSIWCQSYHKRSFYENNYHQDNDNLCEDNDISELLFTDDKTMETEEIEFPANCDPSLLQQYIEF